MISPNKRMTREFDINALLFTFSNIALTNNITPQKAKVIQHALLLALVSFALLSLKNILIFTKVNVYSFQVFLFI